MESGPTQRLYDTFVMTGDMIIKTTSAKVGSLVPASTNVANTCPISDPSPKMDKICLPAFEENVLTSFEEFCHEKSLVEPNPNKYSRILLDIPPDDISSDDEQFKNSHVDIDIDALPPPPEELLSSHLEKNGSIKSALSKVNITSKVNENGYVDATPGAVNNSPSADWRNSLDAAIAQLELETSFVSQLTMQSGGFGSEPVSVAMNHDAENDNEGPPFRSTEQLSATTTWPVPSSSPVGRFRATKSQESCIQFGNDFSSVVQFDFDSALGNSSSVEVLHHEPSTASLLNQSPKRKVPKQSRETISCPNQESDGNNASKNPWWEIPASANDQPANSVSRHLQETPGNNSHMQECYLVCPKSANIEVTSNNEVDNSAALQLNISPAKKAVNSKPEDQSLVTSLVCSAQATAPDSFSEPATESPVYDDMCRPQQLKEVDRPSAIRLAKRLFHLDGFRKSDVAKHLSKKNEFSFLVGEQYARYFSFTGLALDAALRVFLRQLVLTGETQERERILAHLSRRYVECNPQVYNSEDACHTLTCAIMLLNTDLHKQNTGRRMTVSEFIDNLADLNDGVDFDRTLLSDIYRSIREEPIEFEMDPETAGVEQPNESGLQPGQFTLGVGSNPFLTVPDPSKTVEYKKGFIMRKCCADPDARKTSLGRRGWKMWYAVLRDMILYIHKDERSYKQGSMVNHANNAIHVHHALATHALNYKKKQHVFWLQTADWSQYMFQTSNSEDCQKWIDAINYSAASLSAPPLPGACGSQRKFQRPLMPSSYTRLSLKDQLEQHETYLANVECDLAEHTKNPPERGAKPRLIRDYIEKENYLQFESIENRKLYHPIILEILIFTHRLIVDGKQLVFMWLPSHAGLASNVSADAAAKAALNLAESQTPVPYSDFYPLVHNYISSKWQRLWNAETSNKLHSIEPMQRRFKTYCILLRSRMFSTQLSDDQAMSGSSELSSAAISEGVETAVKDVKPLSSGINRSTSDRNARFRVASATSKTERQQRQRGSSGRSSSLQAAKSMPMMFETRV